ncbi:MAG: hypothetical protein EOP10_21510 [Proteobacteria bacterium]|nr:MAG: hypothetical protein EOP10_21510 [Pseudomonadota bacterium]
MSSTTESTAKTTDQLKYEVDLALAQVGADLTELKDDLTPQNIMDEVIIQNRFPQLRAAVQYLYDNPYILVGAGLAAGALIALAAGRKYADR